MKSTKWSGMGMRLAARLLVRCCTVLLMALYPILFLAGRFTVKHPSIRPPFWFDFTHGYSKLWTVLRNGFL